MSRFIMEHVESGTKVYTDDTLTYHWLPNNETVRHSIGEYVQAKAHTDGVESSCSMMKRAHVGTFQKVIPKHLQRYVNEIPDSNNIREAATEDQMGTVTVGMLGKRIKCQGLIADNGLDKGSR